MGRPRVFEIDRTAIRFETQVAELHSSHILHLHFSIYKRVTHQTTPGQNPLGHNLVRTPPRGSVRVNSMD